MKRILGLALSHFATLGMISLTLAPVSDVSALSRNDCCEDECCAPACESNMWCWLGGALLGAAAGAGTGYAASQDGKRGRRGDEGPAGPGGIGLPGPAGATGATGATGAPGTFEADEGETLTFNSVLNVTAGIGGSVIPFVSFPDGTVLEGAPVPITVLGPIVFPPFVIQDPVYGEYNVGVQTDSSLIAVSGSLVNNAVASRDSSTTIFANLTPVISLLGTQTQTSEDFVYGPVLVP